MTPVRTCAAFVLLAPTLAAQAYLDTARRYLRNEKGEFQYLADLDLDGDDDLVWFRESSDRWREYQVYENDGQGELAPIGARVAFPSTGNRFVAVGTRRLQDVTGDGRPDLLVAELPSAGSTTLHVYPGSSPGAFGAPLPILGPGSAVALGNVDLDPARELGVAETSGVAWYDWDGAAFVRSTSSPLGGSAATGVIAFDLEGDGDDDLLYGETNGRSLILYPTSGGAPGPAIGVPLPGVGTSLLVAHVCDLDGAGQPDVLVAAWRWNNGTISLIPVLNEGGLLVPGEPQPLSNAGIPSSIMTHGFRIGDWDGDGDPDAFYYPWKEPGVHDAGTIALFENRGATGFAPDPVAKAVTNYEVSSGRPGGKLVDTVDLDRDGRLDLVGPTGVLFGRGRIESSLVAISDNLFADPFIGPNPVALLDFDGDGDLDPIIRNGTVLLNDGTGAFPSWLFSPPPPPNQQHGTVTGIGDFSGDGRTDLLMSIFTRPAGSFENPVFEEIRMYAADGLGGFLDAGRVSSTVIGGRLADDLDRDGDLDLLGAQTFGGYWPNTGRGFGAFVPLFGEHETPAALGDLDADGDPDVVTKDNLPTGIVVWKNARPRRVRSMFGFEPRFSGTRIFDTTNTLGAETVNLDDHDADGDLDLAFSPFPREQILLLVNDGSANFSPGAVLSTGFLEVGEPAHAHLVFEDIDADGKVDLFAGSEGEAGANVLLFRGLGGGLFDAPRSYAGSSMGPQGDLDGDGDQDLSGRAIVRSLRFDGPADGRSRQYGTGTPGSGGAVPLLGAAGPLRVGSTRAEIRLRRGLGAAPFALFYSLSAGTGHTIPFRGAPTLLRPPLQSKLLTALGEPGQAGAGTFDLDLVPGLAQLAGQTLYFQVGLIDPGAASGFALSNGLELTFGF